MFKFCYCDYIVKDTENIFILFEVIEINQRYLKVSMYNIDRVTHAVVPSESKLVINIDPTKKEEFVEVLGVKVYASKFYKP